MLAVSCLARWGDGLLNEPNSEGEGLLGDGDRSSLRPGERRKLSKSPEEREGVDITLTLLSISTIWPLHI